LTIKSESGFNLIPFFLIYLTYPLFQNEKQKQKRREKYRYVNRSLQFLNNVNINKTKVLLPQA